MGALERIDARFKLLFLAVFSLVVLHARTFAGLALCASVALGISLAARISARDLHAALRPLAAILVVTALAQVLAIRQGPVLLQLGPLAITTGALAETARTMTALVSLMALSVSFMRVTSSSDLVDALGRLLGPLRRGGNGVDGALLALSVAFRFIPVLIGEFRQMRSAQIARHAAFDGTVRERLAAYLRLFAPLVRSSFRHADLLAEALVARCFGGVARPTALREPHPGIPEALCLMASVGLVAGALLLG